MSKHWNQATAEQIAWADEHDLWALEPERPDGCTGCEFFTISCEDNEPCVGDSYQPSIIFKRKDEEGKSP